MKLLILLFVIVGRISILSLYKHKIFFLLSTSMLYRLSSSIFAIFDKQLLLIERNNNKLYPLNNIRSLDRLNAWSALNLIFEINSTSSLWGWIGIISSIYFRMFSIDKSILLSINILL